MILTNLNQAIVQHFKLSNYILKFTLAWSGDNKGGLKSFLSQVLSQYILLEIIVDLFGV